jgi:hypothetical protein
MKKLLREPLLHFLIAGAALFLIYGAWGNSDTNDYTIVVEDSDIDMLINRWQTQWKRYPTEKELQFLFDQFLQEEVYYREALNMSLDHNDEIIRRRMAQKMEFLTKDLADMSEPDDEELQVFFQKHIEIYTLSPSVTFAHAYFSDDKRKDAAGDATKELQGLQGQTPTPELFEQIGDRISVRTYFESSNYANIQRQMGSNFADAIMQSTVQGWLSSPVRSGFGVHLVYVFEVLSGRVPELEVVKEKLLQDYKFDLSQEYDQNMFRGLVAKYDVILQFEEYGSLQNTLSTQSDTLQ